MSSNNNQSIENIFIDPISLEEMMDPFITPCGHSFSADTIIPWLDNNDKCPLCDRKINQSDLSPNYTLRDILDHFSSLKIPIDQIPSLIKSQLDQSDNDDQKQQQQQPPQQAQQQKNEQKQELLLSISNLLAELIQQQPQLLNKFNQNNNDTDNTNNNTNHNNNNNIVTTQKSKYNIREIWGKEAVDASLLMERSTKDDVFLDFIFGNVSWKQSGTVWYINKMLDYSIRKARVYSIFNNDSSQQQQMIGILICQPPFEVGVNYIDMIKVGMLGAPFKMGWSALKNTMKLYEYSDIIHREISKFRPHWYVNAICVDPKFRRSGVGKQLLQTILKLADSQQVGCYTETDPKSLNFFLSNGFVIDKECNGPPNSGMPKFYGLWRSPMTDNN
eukprot:gene1410-1779_t